MLSENEKIELTLLCKHDKAYKHYVDRLNEEHMYSLSQLTSELRNPLTLINSNVQLIASIYPELLDSKYWKQLSLNLNHFKDLLNDISRDDYSRLLNMEETDLHSIIYDLKSEFLTIYKEKKIAIYTDINKSSKEFLMHYTCDKIKIREMLFNILLYSCKHVYANGCINIDVDADTNNLCQFIDTLTYFSISISINCPKLSENEQANIFNLSESVEENSNDLELPIVANIVSAHGGKITCTSNNAITCFKILLPI